MPTFSLPHFGELDLSSLEEYYDVEIEYKGTQIQIDINFDSKVLNPKRAGVIKKFIKNIPVYDLLNKSAMENDFNNPETDTVKFYLQHQLEEVDPEELSELLDFNYKSIVPEKQLLQQLHLVRVGIYPENDGYFATFGYSIGQEITNYLVVINTNESGELVEITMES